MEEQHLSVETPRSPIRESIPESDPQNAQTSAQISKSIDRGWIAAFKAGDITAFEQLVEKYERRVYNHCLRMTNDAEESHDLTQEVFLKVFRNILNYQPNYSFYTWLYRITVNCCIDHIRKKKRNIQGISLSNPFPDENGESGKEQDIPDTTFFPEDHLATLQLRSHLRAAIEQLSEKLRMIIILKEIEGFSYEEIAEILSCSRGTVKSRLFRARERLKEILSAGQSV